MVSWMLWHEKKISLLLHLVVFSYIWYSQNNVRERLKPLRPNKSIRENLKCMSYLWSVLKRELEEKLTEERRGAAQTPV